MLTAALLVLSLARLLQGSEVTGVGNVILQEIVNIVQNEVQHEGCKRDSLLLIEEFQNYTDWALQMVDATAKFPVGILQGNLRQLGDFDECVTASGDGIRGQYCLANLQAAPGGPVWERVLHRATSGRRHLENTRGRRYVNVVPIFARLEWAICVPSSCPAHDVQAVINVALQRLDLQIDAEVLPDACQLEGNSWPQFNFADYVMIAIIVVTTVLLFAGSAYDKYLERNKDMKHKTVSNLRFAYDTTLLASSEDELAELLKDASFEYGLEINLRKSKLMIIDRVAQIQLTEQSNDNSTFDSPVFSVFLYGSETRTLKARHKDLSDVVFEKDAPCTLDGKKN
ncbi:nose resistant to fluoxetine protein 6-like [Anabrus simplex]|uniref:nose resistant to fluoxetine protein 6-like n=1 Tax=Anabrus simplex TaxID=316456 RepID=UPI0035A28BAA